MNLTFLKSVLSEADGTGSTKRTAVMWTAIPIWTFINIMCFATKVMVDLRASLMFYDFAFMVSGLGIIALEKIFNKPALLQGENILMAGKEGNPSANELATNITAASNGIASLPVILLIAVCAAMFTGCARKVSINKSTETDTHQLNTKLVDTTKTVYAITQTQQNYYGDTVNGSMFFAVFA